MFKDILLAVTPSEICDNAVDAAIAFAKKYEAKITLLHVCGLPTHGWGSIEYLIPSGEVDRIRNMVEEHYQDRLKDVPEWEIRVVPGIAHVEVLRIAWKMDCDLVVMGPHTKEFVEKRSKMWGMAGSTLERVSQKARCPVMIVSRKLPENRPEFANILVATDFSRQAECAVGYAGQMARFHKASLTVFHVVDPTENGGRLSQPLIEEKVAKAREHMAQEFDPRLKGIANYHYECCEGEPAMEILKMARERGAELIIMAHHSKENDPEAAFLGSTVAQVALNATCPTMSVNRHFDLRCGMFYDETGQVVHEKKAPETAEA